MGSAVSSERSEPAKGASGDDGPPKKPLHRSLRSTAKRLGEMAEEQRPTAPQDPRQKMRPCLDGLTESLTLQIFEELDFRSLAAVKRVSRRLGRIASDASLFRRVSRVQWTAGSREWCGWPWGGVPSPPSRRGYHWGALPEDAAPEDFASLFRTDCLQLGPIRMPGEVEAATAKFLVILEGLLKGGASPVSLQTPRESRVDVARALSALLAKHDVRLEALTCCYCNLGSVVVLLRCQPHIAFLTIPFAFSLGYHFDGLRSYQLQLPSLRHLTIDSGLDVRWLEKMVPQLRSLVFNSLSIHPSGRWLEVLRRLMGVEGGGLLFWGVGDFAEGDAGCVGCVGCVGHVGYVALAVEDFRAEELGGPFLKDGRPSDPWHLVTHRIPQPTPNLDTARRFIEAVCKHQPDPSDQ